MSRKNEQKVLVEQFLVEIKKNLPEWIKNDEKKLNDIILEIQAHIWDSAMEISGSDKPDTISIQKAINNLGSPKDITRGYKARGTPKYFISEELWDSYTKIIAGLILFISALMSIIQIVLVEPRNLIQAMINAVTYSYGTVSVFVIFITMLFVYFSKEGFFPEDFESMDQKNKKDKKNKKFVYYKPGDHFVGGLVSFIFGLLFILLPIDMLNLFRLIFNIFISLLGLGSPINEYVTISFDLRIWLMLMGTISVINGIVNILRINSPDPNYHIKLNIFAIITSLAELSLTVYLVYNLNLLLEVLPLSETVLLILIALGIIGTISDIGKYINHNIKLFNIIQDKKKSFI